MNPIMTADDDDDDNHYENSTGRKRNNNKKREKKDLFFMKRVEKWRGRDMNDDDDDEVGSESRFRCHPSKSCYCLPLLVCPKKKVGGVEGKNRVGTKNGEWVGKRKTKQKKRG